MTRELTIHRRAPEAGPARQAVMFLHGYGADGQDLLGLAEPLAPHLPGTLFLAPDAPERSALNPMGYQWAPIPWIDGSDEAVAAAAFEASAADVAALIERVLEEEALPANRLILFGFSQGTMLSLHVAPRRGEPVAGVVGFSGRLLVPERLAAEARSRPPVLLVHGDADEVVPFASLDAAGQALVAAGFETYAHVMRGTGHGIAPDGLSASLGFMRQVLGIGAEAG